MEHFPIIDTHLHLWDIGKLNYPWLDNVPSIKKTLLIEDYQEATKNLQIEKMVFVQCECLAEQKLQEIEFVKEQARKDNRIQGMVAYAPLEQGRGVSKLLEGFYHDPFIKGVRRMYDDRPEICYSSSFLEALNLLPEYDLSFDISIKPSSLKATIKMLADCPHTKVVLDHLGKPNIKDQALPEYIKYMETLASFPNVVVKASGLITEADWQDWKAGELAPYIEHAINCFGYDRVLFGGDWPVVLLAGSFEGWLNALLEILSFASREELLKIFYYNAMSTYKLQTK